MNSIADLHIHTYHSDGIHSPKEVVDKACEQGIDIISITDHDSINALPEAIEYGQQKGIEVIPGVEISTDIHNSEVHLLGYFINYNDREFNKYLTFFRDERFHRAKRIIRKLQNLGINIGMDDVLKHASLSALGRPHIAKALIEQGYVENYYDAFDKYLGDNGPAFERKIHVSVQSAVKLIGDAGGLAFVAHPNKMKEHLLLDLIDAGIDGIEVVHPSHQEHQVKFYNGIVSEYCLLGSGGSDFHGGLKNDYENLGKHVIPSSSVDTMRNMLVKNSA
ncbi:MAG: PHP domain-containing protein [Bacteroidetes bacterium]|nr:PHP domain-containing protein [Bacteroidota bacterium]